MSALSKIGKFLSMAGAPILATLTGGPIAGVATVLDLVGSTLGVPATEDAIEKAIRIDPDAAAKVRIVESDNTVELQRLRTSIGLAQIQEGNRTYRAELASDILFIKCMRPAFGYIMALSWLGVFGPFGYRMATAAAMDVLTLATALAALIPMFAMGLTVLGIYIQKRTDEKSVNAGFAPKAGIFAAIASRISGQ